jgi:threonine dehydratase
VVAVLSGGNIDPLVLLHVIEHGMAAAARYLSMRVRVVDRPGALAELLTQIGDLGANVVDVEHTRISAAIPLGDVDVQLSLETRGATHSAAIVDALRNSGHAVFDEAGAPWGSGDVAAAG